MSRTAVDTSVAIALVVSTHRAHRIASGWARDTLVAMAAKTHGLALATRDARARVTYEAVGVSVELVV